MKFAAIPIVTSTAALLLAGAWQHHDHGVQRDEYLEAHRDRGAMVLAAIEGTAAREFRGDRYIPESLQESLDAAFARFDLEWLRITDPEGTVLAELGASSPRPDPLYYFEGTFEPIRPRDPARRWRGGAAGDHTPGMQEISKALKGTPLTLSLRVDRDPLRQRLNRSRARFLLSSAAIGLAIVLFGAVFWTRLRAQALRSQLDAEHKEVESLDRLRRVGAGLVHETKNPLGVVRGFAERIMRTPMEPGKLRATARAIVEETDRTVARLDEFLLFSRPATLRRERFDIRPLFEELAELIEPELEVKLAVLQTTCDGSRKGGIQIHGDRDQLRRLFLNLLLNATRAIDDGGHIWLSCRSTGSSLQLIVEDDGPGVPTSIHHTLFEPYVTESEGGSGLGLSICARVAQDHGFTLRHEARTPHGARMILEIPRP